ncbi:MAG: hypothetical protein WAQ24_02950 [Candidatus Saccharimonadales bacterium]
MFDTLDSGHSSSDRLVVGMREARILSYNSTKPALLETHALAGCLAVAAMFQGEQPESATLFLSHFPPSVNGLSDATVKMFSTKSDLSAIGQKIKTAYVVAPNVPTVSSEINCYKYALGVEDETDFHVVPYLPGTGETVSAMIEPGPILRVFLNGIDCNENPL